MNLVALAGSYAAAGKRRDAERVFAKLDVISKKRYVCAYEMGTAYAILGEKDKAVACLRRAYRVRSGCMADMKADPRLDSLRPDPRFQELLRNVGFPPEFWGSYRWSNPRLREGQESLLRSFGETGYTQNSRSRPALFREGQRSQLGSQRGETANSEQPAPGRVLKWSARVDPFFSATCGRMCNRRVMRVYTKGFTLAGLAAGPE